MLREVTPVKNFQQLFDFVVFQIFLCFALIAELLDFYGRVGGLRGVCIPGEERLQIPDVVVDGSGADSLREVPAPCGIISDGTVLHSVKCVFATLLEAADVVADGSFQDLFRLCDVGLFQAPALKKPQ